MQNVYLQTTMIAIIYWQHYAMRVRAIRAREIAQRERSKNCDSRKGAHSRLLRNVLSRSR